MAKELFVTAQSRLDVQERQDAAASPASDEQGLTRIFDQYAAEVALNGSSYPPVSGDLVDLSDELSGTTSDFDLTAAPAAYDTSKTVDKTGKKIVGYQFRFAITNNAAGVKFGPQGANGYRLFGTEVGGSTTGQVKTFFPGENGTIFIADPEQGGDTVTVNTPTVGAGAKDMRFTGTAGDYWEFIAIFGP